MPYDVSVERIVPLPRAKVFAILYDFGGLKKILPDGIVSCDCVGEGVGAIRTIKFANFDGTLVERLEIAYPDSVIAYSIIANDALPVEHYCAVATLADAANGTAITYGSNWMPKGASRGEVQDLLKGFYSAVLDYMEGISIAVQADSIDKN